MGLLRADCRFFGPHHSYDSRMHPDSVERCQPGPTWPMLVQSKDQAFNRVKVGCACLPNCLLHRRGFGVVIVNTAAGVCQVIRTSHAMDAQIPRRLAAFMDGNGLIRFKLRLPGEGKQPRLDLRRAKLRNAQDTDFIVEQRL